MEPVSLSCLLAAEEESLRNTLRADEVIDRNRKQSLDRLNETFDHMLLRYNAANADDRVRQAAADCQAAAVRDMLGLLLAGTARKEISKRRMRTGAVIALLFAVIFCLVTALLVRKYYLYGCIATAVAALCAFLAGRLWYGEREVRVHAGLDPDVVWRTLNKTVETMDRKTDEFLTQEQVWAAESGSSASRTGSALREDELRLIGDLLEALYSANGEYALRQLNKLSPWLRQRGIETVDYSPETRELFEILPTKRQAATLRPALLADGKPLLAGRATENMENLK